MRNQVAFLCLMIFLVVPFQSSAVPPHPRVLEERMNQSSTVDKAFMGFDAVPGGYSVPMEDGIEYVLVIRVDFPDKKGTRSREEIDSYFFSENSVSLHTYYKEVSYGQMIISPGPVGGTAPAREGWYRMPKNMTYYGRGVYFENLYVELVRDACNAADADVDFSQYDRNKDGLVDHLVIIHAGDDEATSGVSDDIWSMLIHSVGLVYDGVKINNVAFAGEEPSFDKPHLGIFFHEFFHDFGAPDLYSGVTVGPHDQKWCLMGMFGPYQGDDNNGLAPAHICGYLKWDFDGIPENGRNGWIKPVELTENAESIIIPAFANGDPDKVLYKIDIPGKNGKEFFLIENRYKLSGSMFDTHLPESGIIIWHIDETIGRTSVNASDRIWVEDPSDPNHLDLQNITAGAAYSLNDKQVEFTPSSAPNSNSNDGESTGISIVNIGMEGVEMPITVYFGDTFEPNNSISQAYGFLEYGTVYTSYIYDEEDDRDIYKIKVEKGTPVEIRLSDLPEGVEVAMNLRDGTGRILSEGRQAADGNVTILYAPQGDGEAYISIERISGSDPVHAYHLVVESVVSASPSIEIANVFAYPNPLHYGEKARFHLEVKGKQIADIIEVNVFDLGLRKVYSDRIEGAMGRVDFGGWDARNPAGEKCAPGIYLYVISARKGDDVARAVGKIAVEGKSR